MEKYRTVLHRFFALLIDCIIFFLIEYFYELILIVPEMPPSIIISGIAISYICYFFYSIYLHTVYGQTLGKMVMKVKVLDTSENPIKLYQAFLRDVPGMITSAAFLGLDIYEISTAGISENFRTGQFGEILAVITLVWLTAEIIVVLSNKKRRAIHDFMAGTVVVRLNY